MNLKYLEITQNGFLWVWDGFLANMCYRWVLGPLNKANHLLKRGRARYAGYFHLNLRISAFM